MVWTVTNLAEATGLTRRHINRLIRSGDIKGEKLTSGWIVSDEEAQRFIQERKAAKEEKAENPPS
jgi:hypothetical protein